MSTAGVAGVGLDVVDVRRIERLRTARGEHFTRRWFTSQEIADAEATEHPARMYAALLAVKEAVWKAMGVRTAMPRVPWQSISVTSRTGHGPATVTLIGELQQAATTAQIGRISAEFSLYGQIAVAFAIAERSPRTVSASLRG